MRTFLARCTMLGLLIGGFALTGDAGWIMSHGQSLLNATTVPSASDFWGPPTSSSHDDEPVHEPAAHFSPPPQPHIQPQPQPQPQALSQAQPQPQPVDVQVAPSLAAPTEPPPRDGGEAVVDLRLLRPGERVRLWVNGSSIAFDMVDPATGEAIQQPVTRRVRIGGAGDPHRIERGGTVLVQPRPGISGHVQPAETLGPVQAIGL